MGDEPPKEKPRNAVDLQTGLEATGGEKEVALNLDTEFDHEFLKSPFPDDAEGEKDDDVAHYEPPLLLEASEEIGEKAASLEKQGKSEKKT